MPNDKKIIYRYPVGTFKSRLAELMEENQLVSNDVSEMTGIDRSYIFCLAKGQRDGRIEMWSKLCDYFRCSLDYMFFRTDVRKVNMQDKPSWLDYLDIASISKEKKKCIEIISELDDDLVSTLLDICKKFKAMSASDDEEDKEKDELGLF